LCAAALVTSAVATIVTAGDAVPPRLSGTGLYGPDGSLDPRNRPFVPQYALWTDGAAKSRRIRLPAGARIDLACDRAWGRQSAE
jgi:hypothetical protein